MKIIVLGGLSALVLAACTPTISMVGDDPAAANNTVVARPYASPFVGFQPFKTAAPNPWRATNEKVGRLGGARAHMSADDAQSE